jgi:hypothetical protein
VNLADGGRRDGPGIPFPKDDLWWLTEFGGDDFCGQTGCHRGCVLLEAGQCLTDGLGQPGVEIAGHLADLHDGALHVAEGGHDLGGRLQLSLGLELVLAVRRREYPASAALGVGPPDPTGQAGQAGSSGSLAVEDKRVVASDASALLPPCRNGRDGRHGSRCGCRERGRPPSWPGGRS